MTQTLKVENLLKMILWEIKTLNKNKASQKSDIPITIIHKNADIFPVFLAESLKGAIKTYNFSNCLKLANVTPSRLIHDYLSNRKKKNKDWR